MRIVGVEVAGGPPVFAAELPHGADPHRLAWARGYRITRPLSVTGSVPELTVIVQVQRHQRSPELPPSRARAVDSGLDLHALTQPPRVRQRAAAYGIVVSPLGLLATQFSDRTAIAGNWGLPGGGIDPGEGPAEALVREVFEESGQHIEIDQLIDVQTDHWIGRSPSGVVEDFHAVRIIYAAVCPQPIAPVVHDVGGTTADARWLSLAEWDDLPWSSWAHTVLERHLETLTR